MSACLTNTVRCISIPPTITGWSTDMAGIGFELKKLFHRKGLVAMVRAYGYAGVICTGPMLLGILLQFGVLAVSGWWHVPARTRICWSA